MKELSVEEKAKAYDKALAIARDFYNSTEYAKSHSEIKATYEAIFPELAESEDEKIRKKVVDVLKLNIKGAESQMQASRGVDRTFEVYACNKVIAWLEKQGEQKPVEENRGNYGGISPNSEWSKEDEKCIRLSIDIINSALRAGFCVQLDRDRCVDWFESLKERIQLYPKQEWSEEEEKMLDEMYEFFDTHKIPSLKHNINAYADFIEYLRSQKQWKPSEEQIEAFEYLIRIWGESGTLSPYGNTMAYLTSLLNDLKQLKAL